MLRLALLGCGEHSLGSHAVPLARYARLHPGEISLVAACDLNLARAEEFCRRFGFARAYASLDELLESEPVDACVTVMPVDLIVETATVLLRRGIPCLIEKPLGGSLDEIERLVRIARSTGTPQMVSVNRRFFPFLNRALAWAKERGAIEYVRATMVRNGRDEADFIWTTAIHAVDAARHIAGEVASFDAEILRPPALSANWYKIALRFESGARGAVEILPTAGIIEESYEFFGENFRARVVATGSGTQASMHCWHAGELVIEEFADASEEDVNNGGFGEISEFVAALRENRAPRPGVADVAPAARICLSIAAREESAAGAI
jgi:virulence factor